VGGRIVNSSGIIFWVFTLMALGVTALVSVILSARGLWSRRRRQPPIRFVTRENAAGTSDCSPRWRG
jgi:hypothetical protein